MDQEIVRRHLTLGEQAMDQGAYGQAEANFRYVAKLCPDDANAHFAVGIALAAQSKAEESLEELKIVIDLEPNFSSAYPLLSSLYQRIGEFDLAIVAANKAIELTPHMSKPYVDVVNSKKITPEDEPFLARILDMTAEPSRASGELVGMHFALGKAYNELKQFDKAIVHFDAANKIGFETVGKEFDYQPDLERQVVDNMIRCFSPGFFQAHKGIGADTDLPILIIGMIRSGTTLLNTMLSAHPLVSSAGEQRFWENQSLPMLRNAYKGVVVPEQYIEAANQYRRLLRGYGYKSKRVIDKMPINYEQVGIIHTALPNARFIHCRRNPIDTCLSIYMTEFGIGPPRFAFRKANIVHAYRQYLRYMEHWRTILPADRFIEVDYEDLVLRREEVLPKLIAFLGLEWDESVLSHEENKAEVITPSRWQARQPVYKTSMERWRNYEPWLGEFAELLP